MPKVPYKPEKTRDEDDDYEIVSFEDFCDKSPGSKTDLLTLNDNINYRLCFDGDKISKFDGEGETSKEVERQSETSLSGGKHATSKRGSGSFAPFGRSSGKTGKGSLFSGVIPKPRSDGESGSREHRYQRFSERRSVFQRIWDNLPGLGSGMLGVALVCALCVGAWWAVGGAVGGAWGEEHYRRLWERAHPDDIKKPLSPVSFEKPQVVTEYRYHDHNNLSTKNKNGTELEKKKDFKKSYADLPIEQQAEVCANIPDEMRFDCSPGGNQTVCEQRGCCWKAAKGGAPYCFYPPDYSLYQFVNMTETKHAIFVMYRLARPSGYPGDFSYAAINFNYLSNDILEIKITNPTERRFEVPTPDIPLVPGPISQLNYRVVVDSAVPGFKVVRTSDNVTLMNTSVGAMILSHKFLQISTMLPTDHLYGLGEKADRFMKNMQWTTSSLWNTDQGPVTGSPLKPLYGSHPFYLAVEHGGKSHGVLNFNSDATDVVLQPAPAVTWRTIGGVLDLILFAGPSPGDVISQYTSFIGRPFLPPYWSLGFHLCKYGYFTLNNTRHVWKTNRDAGVPFDVQWTDVDAMDQSKDFTYDHVKFNGFPQFIDEVHKSGMHYVPLFDPGVSGTQKPGTYPPYDRGLEMDIFVKNSSNQVFYGKVWTGDKTVFPDFTHPNATAYWTEVLGNYHKEIPFDGAWLDMNEPSNFVDGQFQGSCAPEDLPYRPAAINSLKHKTLCADAKHYLGLHYDIHNLHGLYENIATNFALREVVGKRPFIISRASFPSLGHVAGHWTGDITSTWEQMRYTIPGILNFNLYGIPMVGADICGFGGNTTITLCRRWMQLGAFYPFSRNHADIAAMPQDPVSMGPKVLDASIRALRLRYRLLPYYYSLFWRAHLYGETVARPLFFQFPANASLHDIDDQFLIGPHVMITPLLDEHKETTDAIYPGPEAWYNIRSGEHLGTNQKVTIHDYQMVSVKGGAIIPMQEPPKQGPVTTTNSRSRPMQLLVVPASDSTANGELYWDDGDGVGTYRERKYTHLKFTAVNNQLSISTNWWAYGVPNLNAVTVFGQPKFVKAVTINGAKCAKPRCQFSYDRANHVLQIFNLNLSFNRHSTIIWMT